MSDITAIEWTDLLCTFTGLRKHFRHLFSITFRDACWGER